MKPERIIYGKAPTEAEKQEVYFSLVKGRGGMDRFINKGKKPSKKVPADASGVSYVFSLNDFSAGKYQLYSRKGK